MALFRSAALIAIFALIVSLGTAVALGQDASAQDKGIDRNVRPGDDFYRYADGNWLRTTTTAGQASYDTRAILVERTNGRVRDLIGEVAAARSAR